MPPRMIALSATLCLCAFAAGLIPAILIWQEHHLYELKTGKVTYLDMEQRSSRSTKGSYVKFYLRLSFLANSNQGSGALPLWEDSDGPFSGTESKELLETASEITKQTNFTAYCSSSQCVIAKDISRGRKLWLMTSLMLSIFFIYQVILPKKSIV